MRKEIIGAFLGAALLFVLGVGLGLHAQQPDPTPRFEMLGREELDGNKTGQPAKVFVYVDKAMHNEILCFAGEYRETLSCFESGRKR